MWFRFHSMSGGKIKTNVVTALRTRFKMSLRGLAEAAEVDPSYLSKVERGLKEPTLAFAIRIANALEVPLEAIWAPAGSTDYKLYVLEPTSGEPVGSHRAS